VILTVNFQLGPFDGFLAPGSIEGGVSVPEPSSIIALVTGLIGLVGVAYTTIPNLILILLRRTLLWRAPQRAAPVSILPPCPSPMQSGPERL
jgi:hypothetical protein